MTDFVYNAAWYDAGWKDEVSALKGYYRKAGTANPEAYVWRNRECLSHLLPRMTDRTLDVGCGAGFNVWLLREVWGCENTVGVDFSCVAIEFCKRTYPWASFVVGSVDALPFDDGQFDTVLLFDVTEHLPHDLYHRALAEARRVAKRGGAIVVLPGMTQQPEHVNLLEPSAIADDLNVLGVKTRIGNQWIIGRVT